MGVSDLWPIFDEKVVSVNKNLSDLRGKKVAVDLSCWTMQSKTTGGLNMSKKPHLKILFYRTKTLLMNGIFPIFVMEGRAPDCKSVAIRKRLKLPNPHDDGGGDLTRGSFNVLQLECQDLLKSLGVPCIRSAGEAESLCAFLNSEGVVDGCITEDNDAFLYGAKTVYRGFTTHQSKEISQIKEYTISSIEQKSGLDRRKLVFLSLILGSDYSDGVPGVGKEKALKLISELGNNNHDVLQRIGDWRTKSHSELFPSVDPSLEGKAPPHCSKCGHPGKQKDHNKSGCALCDTKVTCNFCEKDKFCCSCTWHLNFVKKEQSKFEMKVSDIVKKMENFPYEEIIAEYLREKNSLPEERELTWFAPNISTFQEKALDWFGWPLDTSWKAMFDIYIFWQIAQKCSAPEKSENFLYRPLRIDKVQQVFGVKKYKVIWETLDEDDTELNANKKEEETLSTLNEIYDFGRAYPSTVSDYEREIEQKRAEKLREKEKAKKMKKKKIQNRKQPKKTKADKSKLSSSSKISQYFKPMSNNSGKHPQTVDDSSVDDEPPIKKLSFTKDSNQEASPSDHQASK